MDQLSSSLKKSFKKSTRKISGIEQENMHHEQRPILAEDHTNPNESATTSAPTDRHPGEVIVKIDSGDNQTERQYWRESRLQSWREDGNNTMQRRSSFRGADMADDPPSKLIGQFLNKQKAAGLEMSLDIDMDEMAKLQHDLDRDRQYIYVSSTPNANEKDLSSNSKEIKVSFRGPPPWNSGMIDIMENGSSSDEDKSSSTIRSRRPSSMGSFMNDGGGTNNNNESQVLRCTSIQRRASVLGRLKTKSRLMDPAPEVPEKKSEKMKSGPMKSGMLGRMSGMLSKRGDDDEDDPLFDEDIPEDFKKSKLNALTLAQWISLVLIVSSLGCTLSIPRWKGLKFRGLRLWKWEALVLVLICGRLVSGWVIRIIVFFIERNFFMRKRILYFVYGVRKAVQNCFWLGLVIISWRSMFDRKIQGDNKFLRFVNKVMISLLVGALLWLVKTLMVKVLASSFHVSTFFDRIQESLFNQYVIATLSGPPLIEIQNHQEEQDRTMAEVYRLQNAGATLPPELRVPSFQIPKSGGLPPKSGQLPAKDKEDQGISIDHLHRLNPKNISAWNMKRLMNLVKNGALTTLDEQVMNISQGGDEAATEIRSENEAKCAARKIFRNVAKPRTKSIYLEDLMRFLREDEALKTMHLIEGSAESEKISKASLKNWVVNAFRERRALALTLNDTKTAVKKLHKMLNVIVAVIIIIIVLLIFEIATSKFLLFLSSQVVVAAFVFGNTCKMIFEAVIFVFVMHPFDVGDRCEIDGVQMIVEEMNILTTIFLRFDNQKILYPNTTLATKPIGNFYRSPDMGDSIEFSVHIATPGEKIVTMRQRIVSYIENKKDHWYPDPSVVLMNFEELNKMKLAVWMRHRMNFQDMGEKWQRRALLADEMVKIFKELDIEYRLYPVDVNVRALPSSTRMPPTWTTPGN